MPAASTRSRDVLLIQPAGYGGDGEPGLVQLANSLDRLRADLSGTTELNSLRSLAASASFVLSPITCRSICAIAATTVPSSPRRRLGSIPRSRHTGPRGNRSSMRAKSATDRLRRSRRRTTMQSASPLSTASRAPVPRPVRLRTRGDVLLDAHELPPAYGARGLDRGALSLESEPRSRCSAVDARTYPMAFVGHSRGTLDADMGLTSVSGPGRSNVAGPFAEITVYDPIR